MDRGTLARIVIYLLVWFNSFLASNGFNPIPLENVDEVTIALVITFLVSSWGFWKNNYITWKGRQQKKVLEREKLK